MRWSVTLSGSDWPDLDSARFHKHATRTDWSTVECDEIDASGQLIELRCGDTKILLPHRAVLAAIAARHQ